MNRVDTRGRICPEPLILTKRAIERLESGSEVEVVTDNLTAKENLSEYLTQMNISFEVEEQGDEYVLSFRIPQKTTTLEVEPFCRPASHYVVVIRSLLMGEGDPALGALLMRGFINSLKECHQLPSHVILYNGGVQLALAGSDTCSSLEELERMGVTILLCGTCVDFYGIKEQLGVGVIGNMLKITTILSQSSKVIYP